MRCLPFGWAPESLGSKAYTLFSIFIKLIILIIIIIITHQELVAVGLHGIRDVEREPVVPPRVIAELFTVEIHSRLRHKTTISEHENRNNRKTACQSTAPKCSSVRSASFGSTASKVSRYHISYQNHITTRESGRAAHHNRAHRTSLQQRMPGRCRHFCLGQRHSGSSRLEKARGLSHSVSSPRVAAATQASHDACNRCRKGDSGYAIFGEFYFGRFPVSRRLSPTPRGHSDWSKWTHRRCLATCRVMQQKCCRHAPSAALKIWLSVVFMPLEVSAGSECAKNS